jgi:GGDEF domain-containing protein
MERACIEVADEAPIKVEADLDLGALTALLVESDPRHLADGFVIMSQGRYLGMGTTADVMRALQTSRVLAARYTNPLTLLPGQVPINEHLERLLAGKGAFSAWFVEVDQLRGLNDAVGFQQGDALIHSAARMLESLCQPGVDFAGHVAGARFAMLLQSDDWLTRARRAIEEWPAVLEEHVPPEILEVGYFSARTRDGQDRVRPLPRLCVGILPVLPGVFESRHEVVQAVREAVRRAMAQPGSSYYVDEQHGNANKLRGEDLTNIGAGMKLQQGLGLDKPVEAKVTGFYPYGDIVTDYTDAPAREEALFLMIRNYEKLGMPELRADNERVFLKNYPHSQFMDPNAGKDAWWKFWSSSDKK